MAQREVRQPLKNTAEPFTPGLGLLEGEVINEKAGGQMSRPLCREGLVETNDYNHIREDESSEDVAQSYVPLPREHQDYRTQGG